MAQCLLREQGCDNLSGLSDYIWFEIALLSGKIKTDFWLSERDWLSIYQLFYLFGHRPSSHFPPCFLGKIPLTGWEEDINVTSTPVTWLDAKYL